MDSKPALLTREQAADRTGLSAKWLRNAAWRGDGPPIYRFTKRTCRYLTTDIDDWLAAHAPTNPQER